MKYRIEWSKPKKFELNNFNGTDFNGVYLIGYRKASDNKRYIVYVGQGNVKNRLEDHITNNNCVNNKIDKEGVGYYRYYKCVDDNDRLDIELGLYNKYGPSGLCNEISPPGSGISRKIEIEEIF